MRSFNLAISATLLLCVPAAWSAEPLLTQINPQGGQRGTEVEVALVGARLGLNPQEVLWHTSGIEVVKLERVDDNRAKATLKIPADAQPGRYPMRLRTATGISSVMTFHVGNLQEIVEQEPNSNPVEPQEIEFGTVVNGVILREDVDYFQFAAQKDQRISIEVEGLRLGRTFFDPVIILYDAEGTELSRCDDWPALRQDACISLLAPADGKYLLELRESAYRGDERSNYRLHVGDFPRPLAVFPPGGRAGETIQVESIGDARGPRTESVVLPENATAVFPYCPSDEQGIAPSEFPLRVVDVPVTAEVEPNNGRQEATAGEAPGAFYGVLSEEKDQDFFRFTAKKGQVLHLRLHARRIGSPVDGILRVRHGDGKYIASNDDDRGYPDSYVRFQAPDDGEYLVDVEDRLKRGGPTFVYWLEAKAAAPRVEMAFEEQQQYIAKLIDIPRGNRNGTMLQIARRDMGGELLLDWKNLPANVAVAHPKVRSSDSRVPVVFTAAENAELGQALVEIAARRADNQDAIPSTFSQRNWMIRGQNNVDMWGFTGDEAVVAVTEKAPYSIRIEQPKAPLVQRGNKQLKIVAERAEGFNELIRVRMLYNPPGVSSNNSIYIKQGETEAIIPVTANPQAGVGEWTIVVRGEANSAGRVVTVTPLATLTISEPYVSMELPQANVEQGQSVEFPITIGQQKPFEGEAKVELIGLPPGVATEPQTITKETTELKFQINTTPDARPGRHRGLFCRVVVTENGEPVTHSVGSGELRVDKPVKASPLQQASR